MRAKKVCCFVDYHCLFSDEWQQDVGINGSQDPHKRKKNRLTVGLSFFGSNLEPTLKK